MKERLQTEAIRELMDEFALSTGLEPPRDEPRRYLWTDAFAVCNFLELHARTREDRYRLLAIRLIDQVHEVLGKHRPDDSREGWISGLAEEEGKMHPTKGGLRIGKKLKERRRREPFDEALEWDRDGQYFHYLTRWMHALQCAGRTLGDTRFGEWAVDLAKTAHRRFVHELSPGQKALYWKMSIDLSYPLVPSMGHHDPLDAWITYHEVQMVGATHEEIRPGADLEEEILEIEAICEGMNWATNDPLGLGSLLVDAYRLAQLILHGEFAREDVLKGLLEDAHMGLRSYAQNNDLDLPADHRLAFRELGLSIGIHAVERLDELVDRKVRRFQEGHQIQIALRALDPYRELGDAIETFWLDPRAHEAQSWQDHCDINAVMLATSLGPDGYLAIR